MRMVTLGLIFLVFILPSGAFCAEPSGFTQQDRELLLTLKVKVEEIDPGGHVRGLWWFVCGVRGAPSLG